MAEKLQTDTNPIVLEIKNLSFAYDKELVLEKLNLDVKQRDFLALIGPNGGGKTTLIKLILGINKIQDGSIKMLGLSSPRKLSQIGYVPQNTNVNIDFPIKVIEIVMMGVAKKSSFSFGYTKEESTHAMETLKLVGMEDEAQKRIGSLSGGQRQRVMIARALYGDPKILLLDEPTASIDVDGQKQIYQLLEKLNEHITIIVVTHDLSVILEYATKVAHINKTLSYHDISSMKKEFDTSSKHICEVELLQMLRKI